MLRLPCANIQTKLRALKLLLRFEIKSRSSFLDTTEVLETPPTDARTTEWQNQWNSLGSQTSHWMERGITPDQCLPNGCHQPGAVWKTIKRLRVGEGRCVASMKKWNNFQCMCMWRVTNNGAHHEIQPCLHQPLEK
ncbi:O-methyltransferase tpcA [Dissostichus eleginoides]|uniref:O-methyltransferase tpcA n=1 Tax=Dissostichus eleginoides TaxID=100907 RepID=A0AAD9B9A9_DISEL|nr:O-methyltransferase tpcA [Dissostichus eleginoides]